MTKRYTVEESRFFKTWTSESLRIMKHKEIKTLYPYEVQRRVNGCWNKVNCYRTLAEAKSYVVCFE